MDKQAPILIEAGVRAYRSRARRDRPRSSQWSWTPPDTPPVAQSRARRPVRMPSDVVLLRTSFCFRPNMWKPAPASLFVHNSRSCHAQAHANSVPDVVLQREERCGHARCAEHAMSLALVANGQGTHMRLQLRRHHPRAHRSPCKPGCVDELAKRWKSSQPTHRNTNSVSDAIGSRRSLKVLLRAMLPGRAEHSHSRSRSSEAQLSPEQ